MPKPLAAVLTQIAAGAMPPVILIGGDSEYLAEQAFHEIREAAAAARPGTLIENYEAGSELANILDSYRTTPLFAPARLIVVNELNAFVSAKQLGGLLDKAMADWKSAKTDRKRASSSAKLLHVLGLAGTDLEMTDRAIAAALNTALDPTLTDMLAFSRITGKKASRGEDDAALLMEAIGRGGAPGTTLLLRTGEIPKESATIDRIERNGAVVECDLTRESFIAAMDRAIGVVAEDANVRFDPKAIVALRQRLGIDRLLAEKFGREVPDLRAAVSEAERLATLAGEKGRVTADLVEREVAAVEGGARYEIGSLFAEGKTMAAVAKMRDLFAQSRREDPKASVDVLYGRFLFPIADEVRQILAIQGWASSARIPLSRSMQYNDFKDRIADRLGEALKDAGIVRQRPHPFALFKKWEAARNRKAVDLWKALEFLGDLEIKRKSGGLPIDVGLDLMLLGGRR